MATQRDLQAAIEAADADLAAARRLREEEEAQEQQGAQVSGTVIGITGGTVNGDVYIGYIGR